MGDFSGDNKMNNKIYGNSVYSSVRDKNVGYHVFVWEEFMEVEVPFDEEGRRCIIHHLDQNPRNNEITNLACVTLSEHLRWHASHRTEEQNRNNSESQMGNKRSEETKQKLRIQHLGTKASIETRKKLSDQRSNRTWKIINGKRKYFKVEALVK